MTCRILSFPTRDETHVPIAVEVWSHNHWKAREVPHSFLLNIFHFLTVFKGNDYMEEVLKALLVSSTLLIENCLPWQLRQ